MNTRPGSDSIGQFMNIKPLFGPILKWKNQLIWVKVLLLRSALFELEIGK